MVTASTTTVKSWTADQLKLEAQGDGLMFTRRSRALTPSNQSNPAAYSAAASTVAATQQQQQPQLQPTLQQRLSGHSGLSGADTDFSHLSNLSHDNMGSGGSARSGAAAVDSGPGWQQQQPAHGAPVGAVGLSTAAGTGDEGPLAARLPSTGRFVAASASKPNPFSRAAVEAKGMVVGPNNRVVPAALANLPQHQAYAVMQQVAPVMEMLFAPQVRKTTPELQLLLPLPLLQCVAVFCVRS